MLDEVVLIVATVLSVYLVVHLVQVVGVVVVVLLPDPLWSHLFLLCLLTLLFSFYISVFFFILQLTPIYILY